MAFPLGHALVTLLAAGSPADAALPKAGGFGRGLTIGLWDVGAVEATSHGGVEVGPSLGVAVEVDLNGRLAVRVPLELEVTGGAAADTYGALAIAGGVVYRWRDAADQRWVPYAGGGLRVGALAAGRGLLGKPLLPTVGLFDEHHGDGGPPDPNLETRFGLVPELWLGATWNPSRWYSVDLAVAYGYTRVDGAPLQIARETIGLRLSF